MLSSKAKLSYRWDIFLLLMITLGCGEENVAGPEKLNREGFPLEIGNQWTYQVEGEVDLSGIKTIDRFIATWEITKREEVLGIDAYRMETTHFFTSGPDSGKSATGITWFTVNNDTLQAIASQDVDHINPIAQLHKPVAIQQDDANRWHFNVLVFPLKNNFEWDTGIELAFINSDKKSVDDTEKVSVPAGNFNSFKIARTSESASYRLNQVQWFSSIGMIKMEYELESFMDRLDEKGNVIGNHSGISRVFMSLESYDVKREN